MAELSERMSSAEFAEWLAFAQVEPFGSPMDDFRLGTVASAAGAMAGVAKGPLGWWPWRNEPTEPTGDWRDVMGALTPFTDKGKAKGS